MSYQNAIVEKAEALELERSELAGTIPQFDPAVTKSVVRKIDLYISPLFFLIYLVTFIDRANVGNARVAGLETDLGLKGYQYNISLTVFYIFYALWEIPSNVVCKWLGPRIWIPLQVVAFGLVCMCTAFVRNFGGLVAVRVLLGLAEGGVLPAMSLVLARFYTRAELIFRIAIMVSAASLAGAFGGLLASGFIAAGSLKGIGAAWRNIFFFEGIITIAIGVACYFIMPAEPATAWFLNEEQKLCAKGRLQVQTVKTGDHVEVEGLKAHLVKNAFLHFPSWACAFGYLSTNVSVQGVSLFLPTIIKALYPGKTTVEIQLLPPYVVAFVWSLSLAYLSKRINKRGIVMLASSPFALAGYAIFVGTGLSDVNARYAGAFLCILGAFPLGPFYLAWATNNSATDTERGIAAGLVPGFGQFGAMIATWCYLPHDSPNYYTGNKINLGFVCLAWTISFIILAYCVWENKQRAAGKRDYRLEKVPANQDPGMYLGSQHPAFVYST